ncbi:MAG: hypothetical protein A3D31_11430 [Candidatus Fluviicola riflensis]|nr:MAG: hypothetical protein CHH17_15860 [Candidatus Fluviicola riflensis]OGS77601.1 MAG: hypothetical protein A3D31_11430 [Candidatus Fluviicola riflensis]OGS84184.1 MAG: hypothetical protein A3E30_12840 [Fluviicola sp. RIFCSPHIGHO2_12_FULL_43_24]OGS84667.1 MAG: hypothetical protein A2724_08365 [Fluviicola sp. RIFCSPHIGHO2_01_FULL_43_53]
MKLLFCSTLLFILTCGCDDKPVSHFGFKNYSNENSYSEFLLLERGDSEYDTLYKVYINFDLDSISLDCGKYIDHRISKNPQDESIIKWDISYYLGSKSSNVFSTKKFKKRDTLQVGSCIPIKRIGNKQAITYNPFAPKSLEDVFFSEDKLHYIHYWLVNGGKVSVSDRLILIQLSNSSHSHSASIQTVN